MRATTPYIVAPPPICQSPHLRPSARFAGALGAADFLTGCFAGFLAVGLADFAGGLTGFADFPAPDLVTFGVSGLCARGFAAFSFAGLSGGAALADDFAVLPRVGWRRPPPLAICSARAASNGSASSSVMVSGALSRGRVALIPSWFT